MSWKPSRSFSPLKMVVVYFVAVDLAFSPLATNFVPEMTGGQIALLSCRGCLDILLRESGENRDLLWLKVSCDVCCVCGVLAEHRFHGKMCPMK